MLEILNKLGVDHTIIIQAFIWICAFIITKKILLDHLIERMIKRQSVTTGSKDHTDKINAKADELEKEFGQKASDLNQEIKNIFEKQNILIQDKASQIILDAQNNASKQLKSSRSKLSELKKNIKSELDILEISKLINDKVFLLICFAPVITYGAIGADHEGVPSIVWFQFLNFTLFVGLLYFVLKNKIKKFYSDRKLKFDKIFEQENELRENAQQRLNKFENKLNQLNESRELQIQKAKQNSVKSTESFLLDANESAKKIMDECEWIINFEKQNAVDELKNHLLDRAINDVSSKIKSKKPKKL